VYRRDLGRQETAEFIIQGFETLSQGFYFVKVSSGDKTYTKKAIRKQN
jgi:hypothetical protein